MHVRYLGNDFTMFLNNFHLSDQISNFIEEKKFTVNIKIIDDGKTILDTGGVILNMTNHSSCNDFFILNEFLHDGIGVWPMSQENLFLKSLLDPFDKNKVRRDKLNAKLYQFLYQLDYDEL